MRSRWRRRVRLAALAGWLAACGTAPALAQDSRCDAEGEAPGRSVSLRLDNDLLGGQDENYTNGAVLAVSSGLLRGEAAIACLPAPVRAWAQLTRGLEPDGADTRQVMFSIAQGLWTPADPDRRDLIVDDRPYAAALVGSLGLQSRAGQTLHTSVLRLGLVGPQVHGAAVQNLIHRITGSDHFRGWSHQLRNEVVFQVAHERVWRWGAPASGAGWQGDALGHAGVALGTLATYVNAGATWRWGRGLGDDFGSSPWRPAGELPLPSRPPAAVPGLNGHGFLTLDLRAVARDITLDGNTYVDSHRVDKRPLVAQIGYGLVLQHGEWRLTVARAHRSREFDGQPQRPVFGSVTLARSF